MNENNASEIRRAVVRENRPEVLRRWVLELLDDRVELRRQVDELRAKVPPPQRPISMGVANDPSGRVDSSE